MSEQGCPSSCDNRATLQSVGIETHNFPPYTPSMKTFISHNQLQNKSLRQIMFFLHFCFSLLNIKCPWLKKKGKSKDQSPLFLFTLACVLLCYKNSPKAVRILLSTLVCKTCSGWFLFICCLVFILKVFFIII